MSSSSSNRLDDVHQPFVSLLCLVLVCLTYLYETVMLLERGVRLGWNTQILELGRIRFLEVKAHDATTFYEGGRIFELHADQVANGRLEPASAMRADKQGLARVLSNQTANQRCTFTTTSQDVLSKAPIRKKQLLLGRIPDPCLVKDLVNYVAADEGVVPDVIQGWFRRLESIGESAPASISWTVWTHLHRGELWARPIEIPCAARVAPLDRALRMPCPVSPDRLSNSCLIKRTVVFVIDASFARCFFRLTRTSSPVNSCGSCKRRFRTGPFRRTVDPVQSTSNGMKRLYLLRNI